MQTILLVQGNWNFFATVKRSAVHQVTSGGCSSNDLKTSFCSHFSTSNSTQTVTSLLLGVYRKLTSLLKFILLNDLVLLQNS